MAIKKQRFDKRKTAEADKNQASVPSSRKNRKGNSLSEKEKSGKNVESETNTGLYDKIFEHYSPRFVEGREKYDILDWGSSAAQIARFNVLTELLKVECKAEKNAVPSLLDVGCGFGELFFHLRQRQLEVEYIGIDLIAGFLSAAKAQDEELDLVLGDVFHQSPFPPASFDLVFCSGTLNLRYENHDEFVRAALASMMSLSRHCLVVNFLHRRTENKYPHCHYYHPDEAIALLPDTAIEKTDIIDNYLENDFTLVMRKKQNNFISNREKNL